MSAPTESIGTIRMEDDGTLVLDLIAASDDGDTVGHGQLTYAVGAEGYDDVLAHVGGLAPGEEKSVPPWPD